MNMTFKFAATLLATVALGACSMFGGGKSDKVSEEEKASRISLSVVDQDLKPSADMASTTVVLSPVTPLDAWPQASAVASKVAPNVQAGADLKVAWRQTVGAGSDRRRRMIAAPVVAGGKIFTIDAHQKVSALDASSGKRVWSVDMPPLAKRDKYAIGSGLAVTGDKLLVSSGFGYIAALSTADGKEIWRRLTDTSVSGAAAVIGDKAYVTSANNELYAIDTDTGEVLWTDQAISEPARILSAPSPAVSQDILAAPFSSGELIAFLPANGRRLWQDTLSTIGKFTPLSAINDIAGRPVIDGGTVYAASHSGVLAAIDARSGVRIWNLLLGSRLGPVISGDFLFIVGTEGQVLCINKADGKIVWVRQLQAYQNERKRQKRVVWNGPLVASDRLILTSSRGDLIALSAQTGETVKEVDLNKPIFIEPIAANGMIYVLTDEAQLIAIR
jgi:outer membrane protein assembly factor BamB